jgi:Xaa-Pro aminopeptidase
MQRINALKELAYKRNRADSILVFNWANLLYLTGFQGSSALFVPHEGEARIYVYGVNYEQAKVEAKQLTVELVKRGENLMTKIAERAVSSGVIRLAIDALGFESWRSLHKATRGKIKLSLKKRLVSELRQIKDQTEIELMRKAAELTNLGMKTASETISVGKREFEVAADIEYAMRSRGSGGTAFDTAVSSGKRSAFPHGGCTDRKIHEGDFVVVDFGAVYHNYRCDMTRTFVAGKPSEKQKNIYRIVQKAQQIAFEATKAGAKARDIDAAARKVIADGGFEEFFVHGLGHGVGLEIHEPPTLNVDSKDKLSENNVVTLEPGIYLPGYGGVRVEDTVLVEKGGAEKLTKGFYSLSA